MQLQVQLVQQQTLEVKTMEFEFECGQLAGRIMAELSFCAKVADLLSTQQDV